VPVTHALILALALVAAPTPQQENALAQSFAEAVGWVKAGGVPLHSRTTEAHGGVPLAAEGFAVRCTGFFAVEDMAFWGFDPAVYQTGTPPTSPSWLRYAVVTVAAAAPRVDPPVVPWGSSALPGTCSDILVAPAGSYPVTITTFNDPASQSTVLGWQSACAPASSGCTYSQRMMDGSIVQIPCPLGMTLPPGSFSGTVIYKTSVEWAGQSSWPDSCPIR